MVGVNTIKLVQLRLGSISGGLRAIILGAYNIVAQAGMWVSSLPRASFLELCRLACVNGRVVSSFLTKVTSCGRRFHRN